MQKESESAKIEQVFIFMWHISQLIVLSHKNHLNHHYYVRLNFKCFFRHKKYYVISIYINLYLENIFTNLDAINPSKYTLKYSLDVTYIVLDRI